MIKIIDDTFFIETENTSYVFMKEKSGHLLHLYYGDKVTATKENAEALLKKLKTPIGNAINYSDDNKELLLEYASQEISTRGKGDLRNPMIEIEHPDHNRTSDFTLDSYDVKKWEDYKDLPSSKIGKDKIESLVLHLLDIENHVSIDLVYSPFVKENVISRKTIIKNLNEGDIKLIRAFSLDLDMTKENYCFRTFHGHWAKEMGIYDQKIVIGSLVSESLAGVSSSRANPFVMLYEEGCSEDAGKAYGFNLLYSGNHRESVEADSFHNIRFLTGINPTTFTYTLKKDGVFEVPEAVMSYSAKGFNSLSHNFHDFIKGHIVSEEFSYFPRRVLNNSWEACYFNFDEHKLLKMARCAKSLGVELFVLDDGWFSNRDNDTKGLGDWFENKKKLPHGLKGLSEKIQKMGLSFGIWVEPEMVNEDSILYRNHPEWALSIKDHHHSKGRNQMILDLSNKEVEDYLFDAMKYVFKEAEASYVKWDMNRVFSDYYSQTLDQDKMMELSHRYYLGLYSLIRRLIKEFPHILFESCASGGNRFDLGMLSYMPQAWASDDTDPFVRVKMQMAYSYGYPLSTLGCHVATSPTTTTLRGSSLDTRFNVALFGAFGYEIDLGEERRSSKKEIKKQIEIYKNYRDKIIDSNFYRTKMSDGKYEMSLVAKDKSTAFLLFVKTINEPIDAYDNLKVSGLESDSMYHVRSDNHVFDIRMFGGAINLISPIHIKQDGFLHKIISLVYRPKEKGKDFYAKGDVLNGNGVNLTEAFAGCGFGEDYRITSDFSSRLYYIEKTE